ncbi:MAG: polysaccharide pyruvyl transferase family protein [Lachnospiraceae bacterium]
MKEVLIVNAHWNNRGDEAALRAIIDSLLRNVPDIHITIIFKDRGDIKQFPYEGDVSYITVRFLPRYFNILMGLYSRGVLGGKEIRKTARCIDRADVVIYSPGGAVISDRFWWRKQLEYLFPIAYAEKNNIPVFFAAPSMGPFKQGRRFRNHVLESVEAICVREEISKKQLEIQGISKNVIVTIDSAFLNDINMEENEKKYNGLDSLKRFFKQYEKVIGITMTDLAWHVEYGKNQEIKEKIKIAFEKYVKWHENKNIGILLIPQLFGNQNDKEYLENFIGSNTYVLSDDLDAYFQQYIISKVYFVVGMRYHSNIFSAKMGVPFISIVYEEKMRGFIDFAEWSDLSINVKDLSFENLIQKSNKLEQNYDFYKRLLSEKGKECKRLAQKTESKMLEIVSKI